MFGTMISRATLVATGFMLSLVLFPSDSMAQSKGTSVALINILKIQRDAKASVDAQQQLQVLVTDLEKEKAREDTKAQEENKALVAQRAILSPEAFAEKNAAFKKRLAAYNQNILGKRQAIQLSFGRATKTIQDTAQAIAKEIATKRGIDVVLVRNMAFLVMDETLDITDEVMTKLDQTLPKVKVDLQGAGKP